jgi:type 1 fimbria pilin
MKYSLFRSRRAVLLSAYATAILLFACPTERVLAGACTADKGTHQFHFPFQATFNDPSENSHQSTMANAHTWNLPSTYSATCICRSGGGMDTSTPELYFSAATPLAPGYQGQVNAKTMQFFKVNRNIQVAFEVFIGGNRNEYIAAPFSMEGNRRYERCSYGSIQGNDFASGGRGRLHLMIDRPFVGQARIPSTRVLDVYGTYYHDDPQPSTPMASVWMSGEVNVPQSCRLEPGVVTIDFDKRSAHEIARIGEPAQKPISRTLQVKCNNISEMVGINLSFEGRPSPVDSDILAVNDRNDLGIVLENNGRVVPPVNPGGTPGKRNNIELEFNPADQRGQFSIEAYPVRLKEYPTPGEFKSQVTLKFDFE